MSQLRLEVDADTGAEAAEAVVPNHPNSTAAARAYLARLLSDWGFSGEVIDDATLLTSELVTNAMLHGTGTVSLRVEVDGDVLEVRIHDDDNKLPTARHADLNSLGGRGLWIVECVADAWGSDWDEPGKTVWFRLHDRKPSRVRR